MKFSERITCSVREAIEASGFGTTKIYELIGTGRLEAIKIDGKRLIRVKSLIQLLGEPTISSPQTKQQQKAGLQRRRAKGGEGQVEPITRT